MHRKLFPIHAAILCLGLTASSAQAQCTTAVPFYIDLKNPAAVVSGLAGVTVLSNVPAAVSVACPAASWRQAVLKIAIPANCRQANVVVEWEGVPRGFHINLGDSPTNDAHAGDAGTTVHDAELWIFDENMSLANGGAAPDNPLATQHLALTDGAMKFAVRDQFVSWGQPYSFIQSPATDNIFSIPDPTVPAADQRAVYLGLNRVIGNNGARKGCGVRRAYVTFQ